MAVVTPVVGYVHHVLQRMGGAVVKILRWSHVLSLPSSSSFSSPSNSPAPVTVKDDPGDVPPRVHEKVDASAGGDEDSQAVQDKIMITSDVFDAQGPVQSFSHAHIPISNDVTHQAQQQQQQQQHEPTQPPSIPALESPIMEKLSIPLREEEGAETLLWTMSHAHYSDLSRDDELRVVETTDVQVAQLLPATAAARMRGAAPKVSMTATADLAAEPKPLASEDKREDPPLVDAEEDSELERASVKSVASATSDEERVREGSAMVASSLPPPSPPGKEITPPRRQPAVAPARELSYEEDEEFDDYDTDDDEVATPSTPLPPFLQHHNISTVYYAV